MRLVKARDIAGNELWINTNNVSYVEKNTTTLPRSLSDPSQGVVTHSYWVVNMVGGQRLELTSTEAALFIG